MPPSCFAALVACVLGLVAAPLSAQERTLESRPDALLPDEAELAAIDQATHGSVVTVASAGHLGTGFFVDTGLAVGPLRPATVGRPIELVDAAGTRWPATVVSVDEALGLALYRVAPEATQGAPLVASATAPAVGRSVAVVCAGDLGGARPPRLVAGYIAGRGYDDTLTVQLSGTGCLQTWDVGVGGVPVVDGTGELVGVLVDDVMATYGAAVLTLRPVASVEALVGRAATLEESAPFPWQLEWLTEFTGVELVGFDDPLLFFAVGIGLRVALWDRLVLTTRFAGLIGGRLDEPAQSDDPARLDALEGGYRFDATAGYRFLLTDAAEPFSVYLDLVAGVTVFGLSLVERRLAVDHRGAPIVQQAREESLLVQPTLGLNAQCFDILDLGLYGRIDPDDLERSSLGLSFGIAF